MNADATSAAVPASRAPAFVFADARPSAIAALGPDPFVLTDTWHVVAQEPTRIVRLKASARRLQQAGQRWCTRQDASKCKQRRWPQGTTTGTS